MKLEGHQKIYLRGLGHAQNPVVHVGQKGFTGAVVKSLDEALDIHELVKVRFLDTKEKEDKKELAALIEKTCRCSLVGIIGHTALFYRKHEDPEKRTITLPPRRKPPK
jgi:RNA-binding protein